MKRMLPKEIYGKALKTKEPVTDWSFHFNTNLCILQGGRSSEVGRRRGVAPPSPEDQLTLQKQPYSKTYCKHYI